VYERLRAGSGLAVEAAARTSLRCLFSTRRTAARRASRAVLRFEQRLKIAALLLDACQAGCVPSRAKTDKPADGLPRRGSAGSGTSLDGLHQHSANPQRSTPTQPTAPHLTHPANPSRHPPKTTNAPHGYVQGAVVRHCYSKAAARAITARAIRTMPYRSDSGLWRGRRTLTARRGRMHLPRSAPDLCNSASMRPRDRPWPRRRW
jgi:hypothetical protein